MINVEDSLKLKNASLGDFNQAINSTTKAFNQIIASSQNLVTQLKTTSDKLFRGKI